MVFTFAELFQLTDEEEQILKQIEINRSVYTSQTEFVIERAKFLHHQKRIDIRKHPRFIAFPPHKHDYIEINYVYHGQLTQQVGQDEIVLQQGELLFLNQHIEHALEPCQHHDIIINFIIDPVFFNQMIQQFITDSGNYTIIQFLINSIFNQDNSGQYLLYRVAAVAEIQEIFQNIIVEMMEPGLLSEAKVKFQMGLLMIELIKQAHLVEHQPNRPTHHHLVFGVLNYIEQSYQTAQLSHFASENRFTIDRLSKLIKQATGQTFKTLLQEKRLNQAEFLLTNTDYSVEQIAYEIGYENISYFYRLFKTTKGCTPRQFRKKLAEVAN
ncbi:AraC-type DNA-binding protein [Amphibacillus marinus]|uniref:AraC-type DNA-binding protein n=1 Tax=Amphibacillus marinus TaxID=872970 RepID=A0A1H8H429_9BACI|nr:helix-turn-helix domain-containing protein [Amphibacillus marinus]SEN50769.1 AraC-type DNA-binding protein [Amphibacillus marinus]